jgi:IS5 family transposase
MGLFIALRMREIEGRPNFDVILMLEVLLLEQWYSLSDNEAKNQISNHLSFMKFLGFP